MARKSLILTVIGTVTLLFASVSFADVPKMMTYSGYVTKVHGGPLNGTFQLTFSIYPDTTGSPADWTETQPEVVVKHGMFSVLLGSVNPIPPLIFDGSIKYLGVQVESDPELRPLKPIVSVAYAYRAGSAACGWVDDGTVVRLETDTDEVGIGTTSPAEKLDVAGTAQMTGFKMPTGAASGYVLTSDPSGVGTWQAAAPDNDWIVSGNNLYTAVSGNIGIGTTNPRTKIETLRKTGGSGQWSNHIILHQRTTQQNMSDGLGAGIDFRISDASFPPEVGAEIAQILVYRDGHDGSGRMNFYTRNAGVLNQQLVLRSNGNVGIATSSPGYRLDVAGEAHASSFPVSSDARLKKNVKQLTNVLEKLEGIRGVSFDWNELYESLGRSTGHREIGVIAQEVEAVFPELVTTWSDEEYRALDYSRLTAVLVEAVKELKAENEALKQRIDALEGKGMTLPTGR